MTGPYYPYYGAMQISQRELVSMVRELDSVMPIPDEPDDHTTPVDFGTTGVVVMCDGGAPLLVKVFDSPEEMFTSDEVKVFANGFGHIFVVAYGGAFDEDDQPHIARVIFGMTHEGLATTLCRFLDNDEITCDESGRVSGTVQQAIRKMFG